MAVKILKSEQVQESDSDFCVHHPATLELPPFTYRSTKLAVEQADLNRQDTICYAWIDGLGGAK